MRRRDSLLPGRVEKGYGLLILSILLLGLVLPACSDEPETEEVAGYVNMEDSKLHLDEVEVIMAEDEDRVAELDLEDRDMPNGYYIHNPDTEITSYELTNETEFTFTDYHLLFVQDPDSDRLYTTHNKEEYFAHLQESIDSPFTGEVPYPLFIEVKDDRVISVTEKLLFTQ